MELIDGIEPSAVQLDVLTFFGAMVHHVKGLAEARAEPNKYVAGFKSSMIAMGCHSSAVGGVKNDHARRALKRQRADKFHQAGKFGLIQHWFP